MNQDSNITNWYSLSDQGVVREIGAALRRMRLRQNLTQLDLAERAGIDRLTLGKFENGQPVSLLTFIQILRALGQLETLSDFEEQPVTSPLQAARLQGKPRRRASGKRRS
jgi:transcriptional regulator with XRE-family HTH domain